MPSRLQREQLGPLLIVVAAGLAGALAGSLTDLDVYRAAGLAVLDGESLETVREATGLPFTYPPFAAALFVPLALVPGWVAAGLWTAASVAALVGVVGLALRALDLRVAGWLVAVLAACSTALEPVWQNLSFGQVNLLLMLAVLVDLLHPERRWSGVLLGLAVGVKLTPLVFVVLLVLVGRRSSAARALAVAAATVAVGYLVAPAGSAAYWDDRLADASRVGPPGLAHNQSVYGALTRLLDREPPTVLWLTVAGVLAAATIVLGAWWWRRGDRLLGTCLAALGMLVASPIAWSHHWVWAVPLVLVLWQHARFLASAVALVFVARPFVWLPYGDGRELSWSPLEQQIGNAYLLSALAVVGWAAAQAAITKDVATEAVPGITVGGQSQESSQGR